MPLFVLIIAVILIVAAVRNSHQALFSAIGTDAPKFMTWFAAIIALGAIGFIPGLKPISRMLLALVIVVLIVNNYQKLVSGFQNAWQHPGATTDKQNTPSGGSADGQASGIAGAASGLQSWSQAIGQIVGNPIQ